ncbi:hypothetical protein LEP3755_23620 [Leptolyngbya sp. NIES-3755]|nr:hypothetical protein LEP3755_23620 [Leptolyngbya sp. NIES-3755]
MFVIQGKMDSLKVVIECTLMRVPLTTLARFAGFELIFPGRVQISELSLNLKIVGSDRDYASSIFAGYGEWTSIV